MFFSFVRWAMRPVALLVLGLAFVPMVVIISAVAAGPIVHPRVSEWQFLASGTTPPGQAACNAVGRRCFNPTAMSNSYNYASLLAAGHQGQGRTIAIIDSFGSDTIRNDLGVFSAAFNLPHLCGDSGPSTPAGNCAPGKTPRFDILEVQGSPPPSPPPLPARRIITSGPWKSPSTSPFLPPQGMAERPTPTRSRSRTRP